MMARPPLRCGIIVIGIITAFLCHLIPGVTSAADLPYCIHLKVQQLADAFIPPNTYIPSTVVDTSKPDVTEGLSLSCSHDLGKMTSKMYDATGKFLNSGILNKVPNLSSLGDFDECMSEAPFANYVFVAANIMLSRKNASGSPVDVNAPVKWGVCLPRSCNTTDIKRYIHPCQLIRTNLLNVTFLPLSYEPAKEKVITKGAIATLALIALLVTLNIVGSIYDERAWFRSIWLDIRHKRTDNTRQIQNESQPLLDENSKARDKEPRYGKVLGAFALTRNIRKLCSIDASSGQMSCLNGIRVLSMCWVLLGHTYLWGFMSPLTNLNDLLVQRESFWFQIVSNGFLSVDSFFFLSGWLVTVITLRHLVKANGKINWALFYFHRYWRLTPLYMFVILIFTNLFAYFGSGPLWFSQAGSSELCVKWWWTNLLYIQNIYPNDMYSECLGWGWYLANDMQFVYLSPIIIIPFYKKPILGVIIWGLFLAAVFSTTLSLSITKHLEAGMFKTFSQNKSAQYLDDVYIKPYARMAPFLVGMMGGYLFHLYENPSSSFYRVRLSRPARILGWIMSLFFIGSTVFGTYSAYRRVWSTAENALYISFSTFAWGIGLAFICTQCLTGHGGIVNRFLSARIWIIPARLTYSGYLIHPIVLSIYFWSLRNPIYFSHYHFMYYFFAELVFVYFFAAVVTLLIESPMIALEKVFGLR